MGNKKIETVEESVQYRQPMRIEEILIRKGKMYDFNTDDAYPICPRCGAAIEFDFQNYCGNCGQKLSWIGYGKAKVRYAGERYGKKVTGYGEQKVGDDRRKADV